MNLAVPAEARTPFLGVEFDRMTLETAIDWIGRSDETGRFRYVVTPNADHIARLSGTADAPWASAYRAAVAASDLCINDSRVLAQLARLSGIDLPAVPGSDLTRELITSGRIPLDATVVLVGGGASEAEWLASALPGRRVEHMQPPMGLLDNPGEQARIAEFVESCPQSLVFLAIGSPQGEIVAGLIKQRGRASGTCLCIGASVEFLSGTRRRAPAWMRRASLEWLHRLLAEPRRMWRRYLVQSPKVFLVWWRSAKR